MKIGLIFLTYNRLDYTKLALPALLHDLSEEFSLTIWDNASTDGTQEYLSSIEDPRIVRKVFSRENVRAYGAVKEVFSKSSADLVGIVSNDFLVTPGWTRILAKAHADVPEFGKLSCWHLGPEFFDEERARHKIQKFGQHQVLRHPWTDDRRMALRGYVNGFYYPIIYVEHMDYAWSEHCAFSDRFEEALEMSATAKSHGIRTVEDAKAWHQVVVSNILDDPWEIKYYVGWRKKIRILKEKLRSLRGKKQ
ncbi:MAG: glycosyltransferase family 2 protein [Planctomycetota bacterium]|jgi:glycosyltransferase involved in cell wall biosynthesis